ncbi:winged helix-turn-helix transcriptional regulator, partial [Paenibacillus xylanexedens]|uniref:winged helix-turn-helix transcriptional regulator n=1 Tax=Paenibacillus xylanexedens TaxID=528191 RepID=UPI0034D953AA
MFFIFLNQPTKPFPQLPPIIPHLTHPTLTKQLPHLQQHHIIVPTLYAHLP